jgi:capsid protein
MGRFGNVIERAIAAVSPTWALRRAEARNAAIDINAATAWGRRTDRNPNPSPQRWFLADRAMREAGRVQRRQLDRDDARQLYNTNPLARAAVNRWRLYVAGAAGAEVRSLSADTDWGRRATALFSEWAYSDAFEVRGRNIGQIIPEFVRSGKIDGDCGLLLVGEGPHAGKVQLLTADRFWSTVARQGLPDGAVIVDGVEADHLGVPYQYHIREIDTYTARRVPAGAVIFHRFDWLHPDDLRGNPFGSTTHDKFVAADDLMTATVTAAELAAKIALVVKTINAPKYQIGPADNGNKPLTEVENGQLLRLRAGEDVSAIQGTHPHAQVASFLIEIIRVIGAAESIPMEMLLLHFGLGSFSSTNAAFTIFSEAVAEAQRDLKDGPLDRLWRWRIDWEIAAGRLPDVPDRYAHRWSLKTPSALFPQDEAQAEAVLRDYGLRTYQDQCEARGLDWRAQLAEIAEFNGECDRLDVRLANSAATRSPPDDDLEKYNAETKRTAAVAKAKGEPLPPVQPADTPETKP